MNLRESLNGRHHKELTYLKAYWLGDDGQTLDRQELTQRLERIILSDDALADRLHKLSVEEKGVLRTLLHSERFSAESASFRQGENRGDWAAAKTTEILLSLERKGFVAMAKEVDWWQKKWYTARVPLEVAQMLGGLWGIDNRTRQQILSLRHHMACMPIRKLDEVAKSVEVSGTARDELLDELADVISEAPRVEARISSLPDERLRKAVKNVIASHGGLLLLSRLDRETRKLAEENKAEWRKMLEDALLGTIGSVSLIDAGLAVEGEHFAVFLENIDGHFRTSQVPDYLLTPPTAEPIDFIIDLSSILCFVRDHEAKVTRKGTVYKSTSTKLINQCLMKEHVALSPNELLDFKIELCMGLGLLAADKQRRLVPGSAASTWESRTLREKLGTLYRHVIHSERRRRADRWVQAVERGLLALLPSLDHGGWRPRRGLVMRAAARYIIDTLGENRPYSQAEHPLSNRRLNYRTLDQLRRVLEVDLVTPLCVCCIIEYGSRNDRPFAMRLSDLGRRLLNIKNGGGRRRKRDSAGTRTITTPDFEVLLFPEGDYADMKQRLGAFCKPIKTEQVFHFKVTRERVAHAVASGLTTEDILTTLQSHSDSELPQNVAYSVTDWASTAQKKLDA